MDGKARPARLGPSAFLLDVSMADLCHGEGLERLLIRRAGGETATFPLRAEGLAPNAGACD